MPFAPIHVLEQLLGAPAGPEDGNDTVTTADSSSQLSGGTSIVGATASHGDGDEDHEFLPSSSDVVPAAPSSGSDSSSVVRTSTSWEGRGDGEGSEAADGAVVYANPDFDGGSLDGSALTLDSTDSAHEARGDADTADARGGQRFSWPLHDDSSLPEADAEAEADADARIDSSSPSPSASSSVPASGASSLSFRPSMVGSSVALTDSSTERSGRSSLSEENPECGGPSYKSPGSGCEEETVVAASAPVDEGTNLRAHPPCPSPQSHPPSQHDARSQHDPDSFLNVGNSLLQASIDGGSKRNARPPPSGRAQSSARIRPGEHCWWSALSEQDWDEMAEAARSVLDSLEEFRRCGGGWDRLLHALPPSPPDFGPDRAGGSESLEEKTMASILGLLPREFICPLCKDVIVGAAVLDCGCQLSTFCAQCIEGDHGLLSQASLTSVAEDDYVIVERMSAASLTTFGGGGDANLSDGETQGFCPSCSKDRVRMVPCHALNVAIVNSVANLSALQQPTTPDTGLRKEDIAAFQSIYYRRLGRWRDEILRRRELQSAESTSKREKALATLIQAEEEIIWNKQERRGLWRRKRLNHGTIERRGLVIIGEIALVLATATAAAMLGTNISVRR